MPRARMQKDARLVTAAYKASQPLFDALRTGVDKIAVQQANLTFARDVVQRTHVCVRQEGRSEEDRERYLSCAVKAWRSATDAYEAVFTQLAAVTAADPTIGKEADSGHGNFAAMARTAAAAKAAAFDYTLTADICTKSPDPAPNGPVLQHLLNGEGKRPSPADARSADNAEQPPQKVQRLSEKIRSDKTGHKILWKNGAHKPSVPFSTLSSHDKQAWQHGKKRHNREGKAKTVKYAGPKEDHSMPVFEREYLSFSSGADAQKSKADAAEPKVKYEDVSAEVDARLNAKAAEKRARKEAKKRKRESGTSVPEAEPYPIDALEAALSEKPRKKKKAEADGNGNGHVGHEGVGTKKKEKRKNVEGEEANEKERKKRKKNEA